MISTLRNARLAPLRCNTGQPHTGRQFTAGQRLLHGCDLAGYLWRAVGLGLLTSVCINLLISTDAAAQLPNEERFFTEEVLPILRRACFECHSHASGEASGNLVLDSLVAMTSGGTRGAAVVPSQPEQSWLIRAVEYGDSDLQMPPTGQLKPAEIDKLRRWIAGGASIPAAMQGSIQADSTAPSSGSVAARAHWAYQPPQLWTQTVRVDLSTGEDDLRPTNPIDALVMHQLSSAGLSLSPPVDRSTLLKRLSYDLTGLPPMLADRDAFLSDTGSDDLAINLLVERLLAAPSFGERWARMWMDVARYADNKGYVFQEEREYTGAHQYRSWLIAAFNQDLPYDQFIKRQLAADLLATAGLQTATDAADQSDLPALGFLTLGRRFLNNKHDIIDDRMDVVARGLMGMTLGCARCHDHKYDPVTQADYYAMYGVFLNTDEPGGEPWPHRLVDSAEQRESFILIRGSPGNRGAKVERRFVSVLAPAAQPFSQGSGRLELAEHIASADNPLTARVMANRIWLQLVGQSLVESPSDFGLRSPRPEQLPLLDHLARRLIDSGWSIKQLIREIVTSRVYRQASAMREGPYAMDPENRLLWRMNRRRLNFEPLRDTLLLRSGQLDQRLLGTSEDITKAPFSRRRTVYAYIDRQNLPQLFRTFDLASPDTHTPLRPQTSVPQQGLFLLNAEFVWDLSRQLAQRAAEQSPHRWQQVSWMFEQVFCRLPSDAELQLMLDYLASVTASESAQRSAEDAALVRLATAWWGVNELAFMD